LRDPATNQLACPEDLDLDLDVDPALPVDILVNDEICALQGFKENLSNPKQALSEIRTRSSIARLPRPVLYWGR
jgi:hypothetical protein